MKSIRDQNLDLLIGKIVLEIVEVFETNGPKCRSTDGIFGKNITVQLQFGRTWNDHNTRLSYFTYFSFNFINQIDDF